MKEPRRRATDTSMGTLHDKMCAIAAAKRELKVKHDKLERESSARIRVLERRLARCIEAREE